MHHFQYKDRDLYCEDASVATIAGEVKTPFYLYSHATLKRHFRAFDDSFKGIDHLTCFSMKSNSNLAVLRLFAKEGGGVDIVSGGELYRALKAGVDPRKIVFSGVGKTRQDMEYGLRSDILMFNAESSQELGLLNEVAAGMQRRARVAIRVNPDFELKASGMNLPLKEVVIGIHGQILRETRLI